jgi:hypothetical protein
MKDKSFLSGLIGGIVVFAVLVVLSLFIFNLHSYKIGILNPSNIDTAKYKSEKIALMQELENKGVLLTPQEFTNNIVSYYNTAITILVFLFILFSVISYFQIKVISTKQVQESLEQGLKDSITLRELLINAFSGQADDKYSTKDELQEIKDQISDLLDEIYAEKKFDGKTVSKKG